MEKGAKTSFQKKGTPKFPSIPGTKPSLFNFLLLTSTGVPSLDNLLGGGVPVGTILLVEDQPSQPSRHQEHAETEKGGDYSNILMKYFSAEGAFNHHGLFYGSCNEDPENFLANIPESVKTQTIGGDTTATDEGENSLKIAWRYQNQSSGNQVEKIGHHFNLQKTLTKEKLQNIKTNFWSPAKDNFDVASLYPQVFERLQNVAKCEDFTIGPSTGDNEKNILRVCIHDLGSILWSENSTDVTKFVHALRSLARQHLMVCLLTISEDSVRSLLNKNATLTRLRSLCDVVIQLTSFNKDERQNGIFKDHHGILDIIKIQNLNCLRSPVQQNTGKYLFKSLRTKFVIEKIHLPPSLDVDNNKKDDKNILDF